MKYCHVPTKLSRGFHPVASLRQRPVNRAAPCPPAEGHWKMAMSFSFTLQTCRVPTRLQGADQPCCLQHRWHPGL